MQGGDQQQHCSQSDALVKQRQGRVDCPLHRLECARAAEHFRGVGISQWVVTLKGVVVRAVGGCYDERDWGIVLCQ